MSVDFSFFTTSILWILVVVGSVFGAYKLLSEDKFAGLRSYLQKNGLAFIVGIYLIGLSYAFSQDMLYSRQYLNAALITGPIILAFVFLLRNSKQNSDLLQTFKLNTHTVVPLIILSSVFALFFYSDVVDNKSVKFFGNILLASFVIVSAVLLFQVFKNVAYSLEGLPGIIAKTILFIPCMVSDFFTMIFGELSSSPFVVYVLLALEVALVLAYIFIPKFLKQSDTLTGKLVLNDKPLLLKHETRVMGISEVLEKLGSEPLLKPRSGNMALSMWVYVVPMSASNAPYNEEATIFEFGNLHPRITFKQSVLKVYYAHDKSYETRIPTQTWVHIVYNYNDNNVDLFVNGNLVQTAKQPLIMTNPEDMFVVGQDNGIHGGLAALMYSRVALTDLEIKRFYDMGKNKDPPTA